LNQIKLPVAYIGVALSILEQPSSRHVEPVEARINPAILSHYQLVAPTIEQIFGRIPIVWTTPNSKPDQPPIYHGKFFGHYSHLTAEHVQHLASIGAQEFHSWCPTVEDLARARFARFLLERPWADSQRALLEAVRAGYTFTYHRTRKACSAFSPTAYARPAHALRRP
jgi:hypothetical protein